MNEMRVFLEIKPHEDDEAPAMTFYNDTEIPLKIIIHFKNGRFDIKIQRGDVHEEGPSPADV